MSAQSTALPWVPVEGFRSHWETFLAASSRNTRIVPARRVPLIDLFSSAGGLTLGASHALRAFGHGAVPSFAVDVDQAALRTYAQNFPTAVTYNGSVRDIIEYKVRGAGEGARFAFEPEAVSEDLQAAPEGALLVAGPPCQGHSSLNNHTRGDDPRNELYLAVPAIALAKKARYVVIENVPNVVRDKSGVVSTAAALLRDSGYNVKQGVLDASALGWPQTRKRFFMVASRVSEPLDLKAFMAEHQRQPEPCSWLLDGMQPLFDADDVFNSAPALSVENKRRVDYLFDHDLLNLPLEQRPNCHREGTTYTASYGRMDWEKPAPTLTTGFMTPGRGRFVHPRERRVLTPHEASRLQGFPDWFQFGDPETPLNRMQLAKWIGDAVPSILGSAATYCALGGVRPVVAAAAQSE